MYLWIWYGRQFNTLNLRDYWMPGLEGRQQFNYNYNYHDNPYFTVYENTNGQEKNRVFGNVMLNYTITENLSLMVRTGLDNYNELRDRRRAFSTQRFPRGNYREDNVYFNERNSDFLLTYSETKLSDWSYSAAVGGNLMSQENRFMQLVVPELLIPGIYNFTNTAVALQNEQYNARKKINSLYGFGQVGYKNVLFLDVTGRNDWSSTLPIDNNSYFYPSVTLSAIISDMIQMPGPISLVKVRGAYAEVGNEYYLQPSVAYSGSQEEKLAKIGTQKWLSLFFSGLENWYDGRRTGYPDIQPGPAAFESSVPRRFMYPSSVQALNEENYRAAVASQGEDRISTRVWWDIP